MKILIDMNLSPDWIKVLNEAGIEAAHWSTVGDPRATDQTIFLWALTNGYIVFTNDLDFGTILAATQAEAPSVIQIRGQDVLPTSMGKRVISVLQEFEAQLEEGALITINFNRAKVRILPIERPDASRF
jgi:predicted nuclease of predicted toxin-antitoxin system